MKQQILVRLVRPIKEDQLQRWSWKFRSDPTETDLSIWFPTEISGIFGITESTPNFAKSQPFAQPFAQPFPRPLWGITSISAYNLLLLLIYKVREESTDLTSPLCLFSWLERRVKSTEGTESTTQKGTKTAASSEQLVNKDLRVFCLPSCLTRRTLFVSEKASFKFEHALVKLEVLILLEELRLAKPGFLLHCEQHNEAKVAEHRENFSVGWEVLWKVRGDINLRRCNWWKIPRPLVAVKFIWSWGKDDAMFVAYNLLERVRFSSACKLKFKT